MNKPSDKIIGRLDRLHEQKFFERKYDSANNMARTASLLSKCFVLAAAFTAFLLFVVLAFVSPALIQSDNRAVMGLGALTYNMVSLFMMCHQLPMRSLFIGGIQQAVCARDIGIYVGMALGGLLFAFKVPDFFRTKRFFLLTMVPIAIDGVTQTVLQLRESNNIIRVATGLAFGFGLMFFILTRIRWLNSPEAKSMLKKGIFAIPLGMFFMLLLIVVISTGSYVGDLYVSKDQAVQIAINATAGRENAIAMYIPPRSPFTLYYYPYKDLYNDCVLKDVWNMTWIEDQVNLFSNDTALFNESNPLDLSFPSSQENPLGLLEIKHYYGIWVVIQPSQSGQQRDTFFCRTPGTYYYVDALTGEVFDTRNHD
jgi:uncharacterized membrane protein